MSATAPASPRRDEKPASGRHRVDPRKPHQLRAGEIPGVSRKKK